MESETPRTGDPEVVPLPCMCASLRRAARAVTRLYGSELRAVGLRSTQHTLLRTLNSRRDLTQGQLGERLAIDSTTLSRTLRLLESRGWIRIMPGADRRERRPAITRAGRRQLQRASPIWERAQERLRSRLGADEWQELLDALATVTGTAREI